MSRLYECQICLHDSAVVIHHFGSIALNLYLFFCQMRSNLSVSREQTESESFEWVTARGRLMAHLKFKTFGKFIYNSTLT